MNPCEHWQIVGPNGAGKSTLLSLITGDHPQGYSNDLTLFGRRRGSGETIWDIKKHIGYVSSSLHLITGSALPCVCDPFWLFFDSIGIYQAVSDRQQNWCSSGWIFSALINARLTLRSIVFPGATTPGADRPCTGETSDVAYSR